MAGSGGPQGGGAFEALTPAQFWASRNGSAPENLRAVSGDQTRRKVTPSRRARPLTQACSTARGTAQAGVEESRLSLTPRLLTPPKAASTASA